MKELITQFKEKGYLLTPDLLKLDVTELNQLLNKLNKKNNIQILDKKFLDNIKTNTYDKKIIKKGYNTSVEIIKNNQVKKSIPNLQGFVNYYTHRYSSLSQILKSRIELMDSISIGKILEMNDEKNLAMIGVVNKFILTKKDNYLIYLEDPTGIMKIIITPKSKDAYEQASELTEDEIIGVTGSKSGAFFFANNLFYPDISNNQELKKSPDQVNAAFISDIHVGSIDFIEKKFENFIRWTKGLEGNEDQKKMAKNLGYVLISGDLVDGVGIYPSQESELTIKDIDKQYEVFTDSIKQIPDNIQVVIIPGNHDAVRIEEPQPAMLDNSILKPLNSYKNFHLLSNPAQINIHKTENFSGLNVLMYHGYSYDYYVNEIAKLRNEGGYDKITNTMKFLLKKRNLSPTHGAVTFLPNNEDNLIIDKVPDVFTSGHVHKADLSMYKHVNLIGSSCFQGLTSFQQKLGHSPNPGYIPILDLSTRKVKIIET